MRPRASEPLALRLNVLFDGVTELIARHRPDAVAVESVFHGKFARSALILGHARGVVLLAVARAGCKLVEITPAEVKRAVTGTGKATKTQVAEMVTRMLRLAAPPTPNDAADGVAIALTQLLRQEPRVRLGGVRG